MIVIQYMLYLNFILKYFEMAFKQSRSSDSLTQKIDRSNGYVYSIHFFNLCSRKTLTWILADNGSLNKSRMRILQAQKPAYLLFQIFIVDFSQLHLEMTKSYSCGIKRITNSNTVIQKLKISSLSDLLRRFFNLILKWSWTLCDRDHIHIRPCNFIRRK